MLKARPMPSVLVPMKVRRSLSTPAGRLSKKKKPGRPSSGAMFDGRVPTGESVGGEHVAAPLLGALGVLHAVDVPDLAR